MKKTSNTDSMPVQWQELTASDFPEAVKRAQGMCVLPIGVVEKHGPHLPLGTDVMAARAAAIGAAEREYVVVFPHYYFGQIYEARHQPGCITIPPELLTSLLQAVCETISRNGFGKVLIVNGHGGNNNWLPFFCQTQLAEPRSYAVYIANPPSDPEFSKQIEKLRTTNWGGHACEMETAGMLAIRPDLVQLDRESRESGLPLKRLRGFPAQNAMAWYADYPNHFAGQPAAATAELGKLSLESHVRGLMQVYKAVKKDTMARKLQDEFYARSEAPLRPAQAQRSRTKG
jgi:creatinine amidohydrolase